MEIAVSGLMSIGTVIVSAIVSWVTVKVKGDMNSRDIDKVLNELTTVGNKVDKHGEDIVGIKTSQQNTITAERVHELYVSKELFYQLEKHIDKQFVDMKDTISRDLGNVIEAIKEIKK